MATAYGNVVKNWQAYAEATITSQTETTVTIQCKTYFHSRGYGYQVNGNGTATVNGQSAKSGTVLCYSPTGGTVNQHLVSKSVTVSKKTSAYSVSCKAVVKLTGGFHNGTSTANLTVTVPALKSYTVSYNANGGSGAPGNQTKWYNQTLTLSTTKPSRAGHNFLNWHANFGSESVTFNPGASYTRNSSASLYANWQVHTYTVSYNANGGSGAPGNQTKTYGQTLKLSSTVPTRKNYIFKGWGTSSGSTTVSYAAGANYTNNSAITLYAVWKLAWIQPRITNLKASRCDSSGSLKEDGTYANVMFDWATDRAISSIIIVCNGVTNEVSGDGTSGSVNVVIGENALNAEKSYSINITVTDLVGDVTISTTVPPIDFIIDIAQNGSVSFGAPADNSKQKCITFYNPVVYKNLPLLASDTSSPSGSSGNYGYVKILTLTNGSGGTYSNSSIEFSFAQRGRHMCHVSLYSTNTNTNNLSIQSALGYATSGAFENYSVYYRNPASNIIEIWVKKVEAYDTIRLVDVRYDRYYMSKLTYNDVQEFSASLPSSSTPIGIRSLLGVPFNSLNGYYGMSEPDGTDDNYIRTTASGIIPYKPGGSSRLGTEGWPFTEIWSNDYSSKADQLPYKHIHPTSGVQAEFGVGQGGTNYGIFDRKNYKWAFHSDGTECYINNLRIGAKEVWSGDYYMNENQSITIPNINSQANGLVLTFRAYKNGAGQNYMYQNFFVPKQTISAHPGGGHLFIMASSNFPGRFWFKYLYLTTTKITGHNDNNRTGTTQSGVSAENNTCVLHKVMVV